MGSRRCVTIILLHVSQLPPTQNSHLDDYNCNYETLELAPSSGLSDITINYSQCCHLTTNQLLNSHSNTLNFPAIHSSINSFQSQCSISSGFKYVWKIGCVIHTLIYNPIQWWVIYSIQTTYDVHISTHSLNDNDFGWVIGIQICNNDEYDQ